jgi:hypothetical protein
MIPGRIKFYVLALGCLVASRAAFAALVPIIARHISDSALVLWYDKPATNWYEVLPLGNGRMGAMVFGGSSAPQITSMFIHSSNLP